MNTGRKDKVLIICYSFPPHPGIGGRRWAKFSKLLSANHYQVFVIGANNMSKKKSFWSKDVEKSKIQIKTFDFQFQRIIKNPNSIIERIARKLILFYFNNTQYNPSIITSLPNKHIWNAVKETIVKEQIKKVIVSGDPYLFYYASKLKKEIEFDLIIDYRDLWNDHTFYGTKVKLSAKQKTFFEHAENFAVNNCNKIVFVDEYIESVIKNRIISESVSTCVIHNGFDKDDLKKMPANEEKSDIIKIFFAGSISSDLNNSLLDFVLGFEKMSRKDPTLYNKFSISVFGEMDDILPIEIASFKLSNLVVENRILEIDEYYEQLTKADVGLVILSEEYKNSFVTKFTDYLFYDKYVAVLGFKGYFNEYIVKHNIGCGFDSNDPESFFNELLKCKNRSKISNNEKERFDLSILTKKLIEEVIES